MDNGKKTMIIGFAGIGCKNMELIKIIEALKSEGIGIIEIDKPNDVLNKPIISGHEMISYLEFPGHTNRKLKQGDYYDEIKKPIKKRHGRKFY